jgi:hypothetical protein
LHVIESGTTSSNMKLLSEVATASIASRFENEAVVAGVFSKSVSKSISAYYRSEVDRQDERMILTERPVLSSRLGSAPDAIKSFMTFSCT